MQEIKRKRETVRERDRDRDLPGRFGEVRLKAPLVAEELVDGAVELHWALAPGNPHNVLTQHAQQGHCTITLQCAVLLFL